VYSQVGIRLELWRAATLLIAERPLLGAAPAVVRAELAGYVRTGVLDPEVLPPVHFHNDALQALVVGGVPGLLAWLAILVAPLLFFAGALRARPGNAAPALAGMLLVVSFFAFGLTEVIFWSVRASLFYALMVFALMGLSLQPGAAGRSGAPDPHCARMLP
jgi:O-antigen ligase